MCVQSSIKGIYVSHMLNIQFIFHVYIYVHMCNVNITFDVRTHAGMYTHTCTSSHLHEFSTHVHIPFFQNVVVTLSVYLSA